MTKISECARRPANLSVRIAHCLVIILLLILTGNLAPLNPFASAQAGTPDASASHEKPYALIFGTVWGPDERPIYGVKVKIRRASDKKAKWELYSNHTGEFAQRVPAGKEDYIVWADLKGIKFSNGSALQGQEVAVHITYDERQDIGLHLK